MRELLAEVIATIRGNRMRIALTGFSIAWGIFIFIVLISTGRGFINGVNYNFKAFNVGVVTLTPSHTSLAFGGGGVGVPVRLYQEDADALDMIFGDTVTRAIPVISHPVLAGREVDYTNTIVDGYAPGYNNAPNIRIIEGRDINDLDMLETRKVCVIPALLRDVFFGHDPAGVIGGEILLNGISFQVVGVYEPLLSTNVTRAVVAPITTVRMIWCPQGELSHIYLETAHLTTASLNRKFNSRIVKELAARKNFSANDRGAVKIDNAYEQPVLISNVLGGFRLFIIIVGMATLISGIVGVSNIMLISVRERTREIGIRRSIGARSSQIVVLVLAESVIICLLFGYMGMFVGIGITELVARIVLMSGNGHIFSNPTISPAYMLIVSGIMIVAGILAGYIPAKQAAEIKIVDALAAR